MNPKLKRKARQVTALLLTACLALPPMLSGSVTVYSDDEQPQESVVQSLIASHDTYISAHHDSNVDERQRNFNERELTVREHDWEPGKRRALLKFDLSSISGEITGAILEMHVKPSSSSNQQIALYATSEGLGDEWSESEMTWNSGHALGSLVSPAAAVVPGGVMQWDTTAYIAAEHAGDQTASFMLAGINRDFAHLYSKDEGTVESADKEPRLTVTYMPSAAEPQPDPDNGTDPGSGGDAAPVYRAAQIAAGFKEVTLLFDGDIVAHASDVKNGIELAREGDQFLPLGEQDSVVIAEGNTLVISLQDELKGADNRFRIASSTIRGAHGPVITKELITENIAGAVDLSLYSRLSTLKLEHPRLLVTREDWNVIKSRLTEAPYADWYAKVKLDADRLLSAPVNTYNKAGADQLLPVSRSVKERVMLLATVYRLEGQAVYAERAWKELQAAAAFPDWNPGHFLDTAEMTAAMAIGYDWLYDYLSAEQRTTLRNALLNKGLYVGLETYRGAVGDWNRHGWLTTESNWNLVANGGLGMGALAIADELPQLAQEIIDSGLASMEIALAEFEPDGGWVESVTYWYYSIKYLVEYMASLDSAVGTTFGLKEFPGISNTGYFPIYMTGPTDKSFHFGDAGNGTVRSAEFYWLADQYNEPALNGWRDKNLSAGDYKDLIYYKPGAPSWNPIQAELPLDNYFRHVESVSFRSGWEQPDATYVALKAGSNHVTHSDLDVGTFVMDALGVRWAEELGADSYAVPNYFDEGEKGKRWNYYRKRAEGQNVLVINPGMGQEQTLLGTAVIDSLASDDDEAFAITDLTPVYEEVRNTNGQVKRGIQLLDHRRQVILQDELELTEASEIWWFMHTGTNVKVAEDGQSAVLTLGDKRMYARILTPRDGMSFTVRDAEPLLTSPDTSGSGEYDRSGIKKLAIHAQDVEQLQLAVWFVPLREGESIPEELPAVVDLDQWSLHTDLPAQLSGLSVAGTVLPDFAPGQYTYDVTVADDVLQAPNVTAESMDQNIEIEIQQAAAIPDTAVITVSSKDGSLDDRTYQVHFNYAISKQLVVTASGFDGNVPENTLDGSLATRWSALTENNTPQWIRYYLGETPQTLEEIKIAFFNGHLRQTIFDIETSLDGVNYTKVYSGRSGGTTSELETFAFDSPADARYVRIVGYGNTSNGWNSLTEVQIEGVNHPDHDHVTLKSLTVEGVKQLQVNQSSPWSVKAQLSDLSEAEVTQLPSTRYFTSDPSVVQIDSSGVLTGTGEGNAVIGVEATVFQTTKSVRIPVTITDPSKASIPAAADSYLRGGQYSTSSYGGDPELPMKATNPQGADYIRLPIMKFDVSAVTEKPDKVILKLYGSVKDDPNEVLGNQSYEAEIYGTDSAWNEQTVNWSNAPGLGMKAGDISFDKTMRWVTADVTSYVLEQLEQEKPWISFRLSPMTQEALVAVSSRESKYGPVLLFEYEREEEAGEETEEEAEEKGGDETDPVLPPTPPVITPPVTGSTDAEEWKQSSEGLEIMVTAIQDEPAIVPDLNSRDNVIQIVKRLKQMPADQRKLIINLDGKASDKAAGLSLEALMLMHKELNSLIISFRTDSAAYDFRLDAIDWSAVTNQFKALEPVYVQVSIETLQGAAWNPLKESANRSGLKVIAPAIDFNVTAVAGDQVVELNSFPGHYMSRYIELDPQYASTKAIGVLYEPDSNSFSYVPTKMHSEEGRLFAELKRDGNSIYTVVQAPAVSYSDLKGHFAKEQVLSLSARLLTSGYPDGSYRPNHAVTRAEFNALLVRGLGLSSEPADRKYSDVQEKDWYAASIAAGTTAGLIAGYTDGSFKPIKTITREEMAVMLVRALQYVESNEAVASQASWKLEDWEDAAEINPWAYEAAVISAQTGLMQGKQGARFAPAEPATRGEAAVTLHRLLKALAFIQE
ncbi:DNRLRE domain-containing protein [Paenibacillus sp. F411]|uniref:CBM96 family carbohydrate-binding protein n=1 Tax=Paenibacillus sp. F411 TaxID=2820239 RepID=UPI001AAF94D6|nr:DNRLRE domain-containing protein [Paenibacillus sp. F411]MBO2942422.1 DNRLRE domain-containing protein [Paenibacillus sp. F411]